MDALFSDTFHKTVDRQRQRTRAGQKKRPVSRRPLVQSMMQSLKTIFQAFFSHPQQQLAGQKRIPNRYQPPLPSLTEHIGKALEVHYIDAGLSQIIDAHLNASPNDHSFYLAISDTDTNIVYWYNHEPDGTVSGVKLIKQGGQVLYRNDALPFDYEKAERHGHTRAFQGPIRKKTREYLSGKFG